MLQAFDLDEVEVGKDTKETVLKRFGQPSTTSIFSKGTMAERWYYTQRILSESPLGGKKPVMHHSLMIAFDAKGVVCDKASILGEQSVPVTSKTTKESGYKTTLLKETFRNIGRFGQGGGIAK